jgi:hypothetical protein
MLQPIGARETAAAKPGTPFAIIAANNKKDKRGTRRKKRKSIKGGKKGAARCEAPKPSASDSVEVPTTTESRLSTISVITAQLGDLRCPSLSRARRGQSGVIVSKFGLRPAPRVAVRTVGGTCGGMCSLGRAGSRRDTVERKCSSVAPPRTASRYPDLRGANL